MKEGTRKIMGGVFLCFRVFYIMLSSVKVVQDLSTCQRIILSSVSLKCGCYLLVPGVHESTCAFLENRGKKGYREPQKKSLFAIFPKIEFCETAPN